MSNAAGWRRFFNVGAGAIAGVIWAGTALSADYPERTITVIVPFAPGGGSDVTARIVGKYLSESLGKTVVVDNRAGGGGNIGVGAAARAKPDGYTLLVASSIMVVNPSLYKPVPFDPFSFVALVELGVSPNLIITRPESGINSLAELVTLARQKPDLLNYAGILTGTSPLAAELLKLRANINITHVPFNGAGPALQAVLGGQTQLGSVALTGMMPHVTAGKIKVLVQTGKDRWFELPNVPTLTEAGYPNAVSETFQALFAPPGTPQPVIDRLVKEVNVILKRPDIRDQLRQTGLEPTAGGPEVVRARLTRELPMWKEVIEKANIKVQ